MLPGELNVDPIEQEFFATEALGGLADALVREAIQNSLDAAAEGRVCVRFSLDQADAETQRRYLGDLWPHVRAARVPGRDLPDPREPLAFLLIEDRGTRGLEGDPEQYEDDTGAGERNDFYYFWRNVGRSRKESTDRGRWGLGKTVFAAASRLNSFLGLTVRRSDRRVLLMGQAVLRIHRLEGQRYRPYGYFGRHRGGLALPLEDEDAARAFARSFGLRRMDAPGLSIVVPYPEEEVTADALARSVLHHYFLPLLAGRLEVAIADDAAAVVLRAETLEAEVRRRGLRHLLPVVELARWGEAPEPEATSRLAAPGAGRAPRLTESLFEPAELERLRRRFEEGRRIALDVGVPVERASGERSEARFLLLLERDPENGRGEGYFVRQGITVENANARRPRGVRWIAVVTDPTLSAFLGDAENPAHTEWQRSSPKFKRKYVRGPSTLDFVRAAPQNVAALLSRPAEGRDPNLLRSVFSLAGDAPLETPARRRPSRGGEAEESVAGAPAAELDRRPRLALSRVSTGFRLKGVRGRGGPRRIEVRAAYEVLRGNPFSRYSPLDFCMERTIAVKTTGARIVSRHENRLELEVLAPEFELLATRFDEHRDLRVKVLPLEEPP